MGDIYASLKAPGGGVTVPVYEEGVWTPELTGSVTPPTSIAYNQNDGRYTRIGNLVTVKAVLNISNLVIGAASGDAQMTGLPFVSQNASGETNVGSVIFRSVNFSSTADWINSAIDPGTSHILFDETAQNMAITRVQITDFQATDIIIAEITYWTTA